MKIQEAILIEEICKHYAVSYNFMQSLIEIGLIEVIVINEEHYIHHDFLPQLEQFICFHVDLEINLEGIDVIARLLKKVKDLKLENRHLKNQLQALEIFG